MRVLRLLPALLLAAGCASLAPEGMKDTMSVEAEGESPAAAQRRALSEALDLHLSSAARARASDVIEEKILGRTPDFIKKVKVLGGGRAVRIKAEVRMAKLAAELERAAPDDDEALTRAVVSLSERGAKPGPEPGRASGALRAALLRRGFSVIDLSDRINLDFEGLGDGDRTRQAAQKLGAQLAVTGAVEAGSVADARLAGYYKYRAEARVRVSTSAGGTEFPLSAQAAAVDLDEEGALSRALEDAGAILGERLVEELGAVYPVRHHMTVAVAGLEGFEKTKAFIARLRALAEVKRVSWHSAMPQGTRLLVTAVRKADEIAAALMRQRAGAFRALSVEDDYLELELE